MPGQRRNWSGLIARLVYAARTPLPAGIRAGMRLSRRLLFAAGDHQVDLQLDRRPTSDIVTLVGQVVGPHQASSWPCPRVG